MSENDYADGPSAAVAGNVKRLREMHGWNQSEFARRLTAAGLQGFHQTTVSRIEAGTRPLRIEEAITIADELGASINELVEVHEELPDAVAEFELEGSRARLLHGQVVKVVQNYLRVIDLMAEAAQHLSDAERDLVSPDLRDLLDDSVDNRLAHLAKILQSAFHDVRRRRVTRHALAEFDQGALPAPWRKRILDLFEMVEDRDASESGDGEYPEAP